MVQDWWNNARCRQRPEIDFAAPANPAETAAARATCKSCPIRSRCLDDAVNDTAAIGIRAGTNRNQRTWIRRRSTTRAAT